ncbi:hypothetical protein KM1_027620 [Entamoeba histolytica HM-3:IMSS]|uniref:Uncharacterized protein n=2 Tax=Entamoeba histolytica TaxID=5759 RepID=M2RR60_ENTHI|nr:Hypothetical protein EHI5A_025770 [Entamoeba histolytica KU27]EMS14169.1 hypothetical protein KM1_027620 [Entamoeba histolytica HM-3:IMSS]
MMKKYACLCGNITLRVKEESKSVSIPLPSEWESPILVNECSIDMQYFQMVSIRQTSCCLVYKCLNCGDDVCCIKGKEGIINRNLEQNEERRKGYSLSKTFGIYIKNRTNIEENDEGNGVNKSIKIDEQLDKQLLLKKQKKIDELFKIKEQKIREFVLEQEDLFDCQRQTIQEEYNNIIHDFTEFHPTPNVHIPEKIKRVRTWQSLHPSMEKEDGEVFEFDEEQNEEITGNTIIMKKESSPIPLNEEGEEGIVLDDIVPCCSVPVRLPSVGFDNLEVQGNTFEEYTHTIKEEIPVSSFKQPPNDCN